MMATYFHGGSEIQAAGGAAQDHNHQTLYLMNPNFITAYSEGQTPSNMLFLNPSNALSHQGNIPHAPPHQQQFIGIPLGGSNPSDDHGRPSPSSSSSLQHHQIPTALHGISVSRVHPNLWGSVDNPSPSQPSPIQNTATGLDLVDQMGFRRPVAAQGLSLSLSPGQLQHQNQSQVTVAGGSSMSVAGSNGVIIGSKYLKAAQELLEEVVNVGGINCANFNDKPGCGNNNNNNDENRSGEPSGVHKDKAKAAMAAGIGEGLSRGGSGSGVGGGGDSNLDEVVSIELPAPQGWTKKFIPKKGGTGTPRRNEIVFIAPTGEEIKNKRQLDQYLKSHTGGPPLSDFDWGTGDTPRRSARLSSKPKATESPESGGSSRKRQRRSGSKKKETDGGESGEDEAPANKTEDEKSEDDRDVEMKDAEGEKSGAEGEKAQEEAHNKASSTEEKADEAKAQEESDVGLSGGNQTQPDGENKPKEVLEQETSQAPEEFNKEEPGVYKVETAEEIVEQAEEKKPEAVEKHLDGQLPSGMDDPMEVKPEEKAVNEGGSTIAEKETEEPKLKPEESVKVASLENVGAGNNGKENQEASVQTENQPMNPDGAPHEPGAAQPLSC